MVLVGRGGHQGQTPLTNRTNSGTLLGHMTMAIVDVHVKKADEVAATLARRRAGERGLFGNRTLLGLTAATGALAVASPAVALIPLALQAVDYAAFVVNRTRVLRYWNAGRPRLETPDDFERASQAFGAAGRPEPTMSDYESAAGITERPWANDLRYAFLLRHYRGGTVADIGCGDGRLCWRYGICPPEQYIGVDPGGELVRTLHDKTGGRARGIVGVAEATTLPDASVDLVACSECFEHLPDPGAAMAEFVRIAKPGGTIVIQSPSAYRVRNLNAFHVLATLVGRLVPAALLRTVVHENTFLRAFTYHWDFTRQDLARYTRGLPVTIETLTTAVYRFNPQGNVAHRIAAAVARWPIINGIWWDMTVVLKKAQNAPRHVVRHGSR